eukprot:Filipodium_phascolosomae@DN4680_c0_g1_i1.p1
MQSYAMNNGSSFSTGNFVAPPPGFGISPPISPSSATDMSMRPGAQRDIALEDAKVHDVSRGAPHLCGGANGYSFMSDEAKNSMTGCHSFAASSGTYKNLDATSNLDLKHNKEKDGLKSLDVAGCPDKNLGILEPAKCAEDNFGRSSDGFCPEDRDMIFKLKNGLGLGHESGLSDSVCYWNPSVEINNENESKFDMKNFEVSKALDKTILHSGVPSYGWTCADMDRTGNHTRNYSYHGYPTNSNQGRNFSCREYPIGHHSRNFSCGHPAMWESGDSFNGDSSRSTVASNSSHLDRWFLEKNEYFGIAEKISSLVFQKNECSERRLESSLSPRFDSVEVIMRSKLPEKSDEIMVHLPNEGKEIFDMPNVGWLGNSNNLGQQNVGVSQSPFVKYVQLMIETSIEDVMQCSPPPNMNTHLGWCPNMDVAIEKQKTPQGNQVSKLIRGVYEDKGFSSLSSARDIDNSWRPFGNCPSDPEMVLYFGQSSAERSGEAPMAN